MKTMVKTVLVRDTECKFILPDIDAGYGEMICRYLRENSDIIRTGYKIEGKDLIIAIQKKSDNADIDKSAIFKTYMKNALEKCKQKANQLLDEAKNLKYS
jgi:DNA-directed RNA polymerase subunit L